MNRPEFFSGGGAAEEASGNRPSPRKELQGPRPAALKVNKDSHKIRKPPVAPPAGPPHHPPPPDASLHAAEEWQPVIIYSVSPKVIHTTVSDFMNLVQRLTGNTTEGGASSSAGGGAGAGDLSPAARLASIERTSPRPSKEREITANSTADNSNTSDFMCDFLEGSGVELGSVPGILSPAPASLPPVSPGFFSPAGDPLMMAYNMFIPSPSTLFSAPMVSPSPSASSYDLFNPFFDF
ncbi:hypothetical protein CDL12_06700 [Handroanthus impetiginosus]|uniref:VQ domain-containing protein n=1 Tax=Handroanthus impetiginosus TaxID=429701 RepID=A0A2G9HSU2_9LAMI|nr:hypothetical protein CDL12_06700 [Handroanthus impetiginosus]